MQRSCPSCGTEVDPDQGRWCPNPDCGAYMSWDEQDDAAAEADTTRLPGEHDEPPPPPQDPTTVIPAVQPTVSCPSCGADNPEDRSLCQRCGEPLRAPAPAPPPPPPEPRDSRVRPGLLIGGGVVVLLVAVLAVVLLDDGPTPPPIAEDGPTATPVTPEEESAPPTSPPVTPEEEQEPTGDEQTSLETPTWVAILRSMDVSGFDEGDAQAHASAVADDVGADPGVLLSDDYGSLNAGYWVVYVGPFEDSDAADAYCDTVVDTVPDCYSRLVE